MTNQETILCENCGNTYSIEETNCPACGQENPLIVEDLVTDELVDESLIRRPWWRSPVGCISIIIFFLLIIGGSVLGLYAGLQERTTRRLTEVNQHYQQALAYVESDQIDLAIAELNTTLMLDPGHVEAREMLRQLKSSQAETPTPTSESRQDLVEKMFSDAKALTLQGNWEGAIELLTKVRDIDPAYEPVLVSEMLYEANYELGLRLIAEGNLTEALRAFDEALVERPNEPAVTAEWEKVSLYLSLADANATNFEDNIVILTRLYNMDPEFADVKERLHNTYKNFGDYLANQDEWCLAQPRYQAAAELFPGDEIETLVVDAEFNCKKARQGTPTPTRVVVSVSSTNEVTPTPSISDSTEFSNRGEIYFARFNTRSMLWEIIAVSLPRNQEEVILSKGAQPAISPDGSLLVYHSEAPESVGLHAYNMITGEDIRITIFAEDVLPRWGKSNQEFVFASQRSGDRRWQIFIGFADGKGEAVIVRDGRTPAYSPNSNLIAYQGTDAQGNNPGIYLVSKDGGEPTRLTTDESDRSPAISPKDGTVAFMSTQNGNWDIWTASPAGGIARPLVTSPGNDGLPTWSPDGSLLAFVSDRNGSWGIYVVSAEGGEPQKVADWGANHPDWLMQQLSWGF
jgi:TolB protein